MAYKRLLLSHFFVLISCLIFSSHAFHFNVGAPNGWAVNPSENYNVWAQTTRFQVNDTLLFRYTKGSDSVLVVSRDDYEQCNSSKPVLKLDDGNSTFKFNHSGPFYFISGIKTHCDKGQKLIVVVLAVRKPTGAHSISPVNPPSSTASSSPSFTPSSAVFISAVLVVLICTMNLGAFAM